MARITSRHKSSFCIYNRKTRDMMKPHIYIYTVLYFEKIVEPRLRVLARSSLRAEVARLVARSSAETLCRAARGGCAPGCARGCVHNQGALKPEQPACTTKKRCAPSTAQRPSFRSQSNSCAAQRFSPCAGFFFIGFFLNTTQYLKVGEICSAANISH